MTTHASQHHNEPHTMSCLEVWGGYGHSNNGVLMPGVDVWVFSRPFQGAPEGGDVHFVSQCGTGRISRLMIADISGHGATVGGIAKDLRELMRRYVNYVEQRVFVERLNCSMVELSRNGLFATAAIATFFAPSQTFSYANAGHPRPLLYSTAKRQWRLMTEDPPNRGAGFSNLPLGMFDQTLYPEVQLRARTGDIAVMYSDSLTDAPVPGPKGSVLGPAGLLNAVSQISIEPAETLAVRIHQSVLDRCVPGTTELRDDVTIIVLRANGRTEPASLLTKIEAAALFVRFACRRLFSAPWPELSVTNILGAFSQAISKRHGRGAGSF